MPRYLYTLTILLLFSSALYGQRQGNVWCFGSYAGVDFNSVSPTPFSSQIDQHEGCASISDPVTGRLLFYTDGIRVWNRAHRWMPPMVELSGGESSTQSALILPAPGRPDIYYLISADEEEWQHLPPYSALYYSVVDMTASDGMGEVTGANVQLFSPATEKLTAVERPDGAGYWIIGHELDSDRFVVWSLTESGFSAPVFSSTGVVHTGERGYLKASPDGQFLAYAICEQERVDLLRFDASTGKVRHISTLRDSAVDDEHDQVLCRSYGLTFSPGSCRLYVIDDLRTLVQYDLTIPDVAIAGSRLRIARLPDDVGRQGEIAMQIGPDGKVYLTQGGYLGAIDYPDLRGAGCGYRPYAVELAFGTGCGIGLPNFVDGWFARPCSWRPPGFLTFGDTICEGESVQFGIPWDTNHTKAGWSWRFNGGIPSISNDDPVTVTYSDPGTYSYSLIYTTGGARDTVSGTIAVMARPAVSITAGGDTSFCIGNSVDLAVALDSGSTVVWSPAVDLSCDTCPVTTAKPGIGRRRYVATVTNRFGCVDRDSIGIVVHAMPFVEAGRDTVICVGESVPLHFLRSNRPGERLRITPSDGLDCDSCFNATATPFRTTTYRVTLTSANGCSVSDSVTVFVETGGGLAVSSDTTICRGEGVRLDVTGGSNYVWSPSWSLTCATCSSPTAWPNRTTTYVVTADVGNGLCRAIDSVTVTVIAPPFVDAGPDTTICEGGFARLRATGNAPYRWRSEGEIPCDTCAELIVTPARPTTYYLEASSAPGCDAIDSVRVSVASLPVADAGRDVTICAGDGIGLGATGGDAYAWEGPELLCYDCPNPMAYPEVTATYRVTVRNATGCEDVDSVQVTVVDRPAVDAGVDVAICPGGRAQLQATGGASYTWNPIPGLSCYDCADPVAEPSVTTTYYVTGVSGGGCSSIDSVTVNVQAEGKVDAGEAASICRGDSVMLGASEASTWSWSPALGLSCVDCREPVASPDVTTTYRVTARTLEGCLATDSVTVLVREPAHLRFALPDDLHAGAGDTIEIPITLDDDPSGIDLGEVRLTLQYDSRMIAFLPPPVDGPALLGGWKVALEDRPPGLIELVLTPPASGEMLDLDPVLTLRAGVYLANALSTRIRLDVASTSGCLRVEGDEAIVSLDSICGLNFRLIELLANKYSLDVTPNPSSGRTTVVVGVGFEGDVRVEVFDEAGTRVATLVEDHLMPGRYAVEWESAESGTYWVRARGGEWSETARIVVRR